MNDEYDVLHLTQQFLRINTTNPPGNEEAAALFLEDMVKRAGIECRLFSPVHKRANFLARIRGKGKEGPVVLLSHIDVVPANEDEWEVDPFGGHIVDGFLYGRGAIDMKTQAICQLLAFIRYHREGNIPEHDIIYLATCDEEVGGKYGVESMLHEAPELGQASFVLSEGGCIIDEDGFLHAQISVTEKKLSQFMLRATGMGGHGSVPHKDSATKKIIEACQRIGEYHWPFKATPVASAYLNGLLRGRKVKGRAFTSLTAALTDEWFQKYVEDIPAYNSILRNTVTPTILRAGEKINVIPSEASAYFDARLLPSEHHGTFFKRIRSLAGKDVEVTPISAGEADPVRSGYRTAYFRCLEEVIHGLKGNIPVLPYIMTGATDLRHFRDKGIPAYGFFPVVMTREDLGRMHGKNERISVENIYQGLEGVYEIVKQLGAGT